MSDDIPQNKRVGNTQLVPEKKLTFTSRGENSTGQAQGNGSHSTSSSSTGIRRKEPGGTSTGDGAGSVTEITPDEGVQLHRSPTAFGDVVSYSLAYTMGGRQGSASPSTSGRSGREHAGAAKAAKTGVAINLAGEYPQDTRATAAAAADGNDAVAECRGSGKRVILGGNGALPTGEGTGMLPPIVSDSATSLKLRELSEDLCKEQRHVLDLVLRGKSVFFTGAAGTGKTFLLKRLHKALDLIGKGETTFMTGTTGRAAVGMGGCTVHSFAGIGLGNQSVPDTVMRVMSNRPVSSRWRTCHVLVIDEISMMEADLFDKLNLVGQRLRGNPQPFGGIQLVLCGDFYQLPPIGIGRGSVRFCFEAKTWNTSLDQSIVLKKVFRQKDPLFVKILHEMREGRVNPEAQRILSQKVEQARQQARTAAVKTAGAAESTANMESSEKGVCEEGGSSCDGSSGVCEAGRGPSHTLLFSRNEDVDRLNERELRKLPGEPALYKARDSGEPAYLRQLQRNCAAPTVLELKEGAKVILLKNINTSKQLVNGRTGVIIKIQNTWGQRTPIVEFDALEGNGKNKLQVAIQHEGWTITLGKREVAKRVQLPLRLAWALSVHKSQGMTIANVMVSMQGMFEFGQAYVALSRATTLDGLHLLDFRLEVVRAHDTVKAFYAALEAAPKPGERTPPRSPSSDTGRESTCSPLGTAKGSPDTGDQGGISPAARERMEANRIRAMTKLAEKRAKLRPAGEES